MKRSPVFKIILISVAISALIGPRFPVRGEEPICETKEECQKLLKKYEQKIVEFEKDLTKTEQEKRSLQNKIYSLRQRIKKLDLQIYRSNLMIEDLALQIKDTEQSIEKTTQKIKGSEQKLGNILRTVYEIDQKSLLEILLTEDQFSDFFEDLMALETLSAKNKELLLQIKELKNNLEQQKHSLSEEKQSTERVAKVKARQKQESATIKQEQQRLLELTEAEYQKYLKQKEQAQEKAAQIRHRLFELVGVPKGGIEFGKAVEIAQYVEDATQIRAPFLLAILAQESSEKIGANVGQCYLEDSETGQGVYIKTGNKVSRVMCPSWEICGREPDVPHFLEIIQNLKKAGKLNSGFYDTPVSCPMSFGWGGAMGPAQFIPSTWARYRDQIQKKTGSVPANPWNIKDSFTGAGVYLADLGADSQTYQAELNAALSYFGCHSSWCVNNYGKPVMQRAVKYEQEIELIEGQ